MGAIENPTGVLELPSNEQHANIELGGTQHATIWPHTDMLTMHSDERRYEEDDVLMMRWQ